MEPTKLPEHMQPTHRQLTRPTTARQLVATEASAPAAAYQNAEKAPYFVLHVATHIDGPSDCPNSCLCFFANRFQHLPVCNLHFDNIFPIHLQPPTRASVRFSLSTEFIRLAQHYVP